MRRAIAVFGFTAVLLGGAVSFTVLPTGATRAANVDNATFLIPASDGYGVADCLTSGNECGKVIATAWCEAHGFGRAASFGLAAVEDMTGSIEAPAPREEGERPISITCSN